MPSLFSLVAAHLFILIYGYRTLHSQKKTSPHFFFFSSVVNIFWFAGWPVALSLTRPVPFLFLWWRSMPLPNTIAVRSGNLFTRATVVCIGLIAARLAAYLWNCFRPVTCSRKCISRQSRNCNNCRRGLCDDWYPFDHLVIHLLKGFFIYYIHLSVYYWMISRTIVARENMRR